MLSFPKLLILVVVAIAAWHLFRRPAPRPPARAGGRNDTAPAPEPAPAPLPAETMRRCTTCGAYAAAACDRADCGFARSPRG